MGNIGPQQGRYEVLPAGRLAEAVELTMPHPEPMPLPDPEPSPLPDPAPMPSPEPVPGPPSQLR